MSKKLKNQAQQAFDSLTDEQKKETRRIFNAMRWNHNFSGRHALRNPYETY